MTDSDTLHAIVEDFEAHDAVWYIDGHEFYEPAGFKLEVVLERDAKTNADIGALLRQHDLRIWFVHFESKSLALVPADGFRHEYTADAPDGDD